MEVVTERFALLTILCVLVLFSAGRHGALRACKHEMRRAQRVRDGDVDHVVLEARDQLKVRVSAVLKEHGGGFHLCVAAGEARDTCDNLHDLVVPVIDRRLRSLQLRMFREIREVRVLGTARPQLQCKRICRRRA